MRDAEENELGSYFKYTGAFLMSAFAIEAYCNYVGPVLMGDEWEGGKQPLERKSATEKLKHIGKKVGVSVNFGRDPWRRIKLLIDARHAIVHAKRIDVRAPEVRLAIKQADLMSQNFGAVDAPWEAFCRAEYLTDTMSMIESALDHIHSRLPTEDKADYGALFVSGMTFGSISLDAPSPMV
ncbi:hypothetical protein [Pandoraea sputorum]|uniref:hypothetical protein n=1 Tax=Pandoraea sputorum TaxID=93222 RepID=UPI002F910E06